MTSATTSPSTASAASGKRGREAQPRPSLVATHVLGNFDTAAPSSAAVGAVASVLAWKFAVHDVDPRGLVAFRAGDGSPRYPPGSVVTLNRIVGHRDVGLTACPGRNLYPYLGAIRASVARAWTRLAAPGLALVGDFDGNGFDDVLWYAPGTATDAVWYSRGDGTFFPKVVSPVNSSYRPLVGDFDGDDDVFWYAPGSGPEFHWWASGAQFRSVRTAPASGDYRTAVGDFDGDGDDDILWHDPRSVPDGIWESRRGVFRPRSTIQISGSYIPAAGNFDGDGDDDLVVYAAGPARDYIWLSQGGFRFGSQVAPAVSGSYRVVRAADRNRDGRDELLWYASPG